MDLSGSPLRSVAFRRHLRARKEGIGGVATMGVAVTKCAEHKLFGAISIAIVLSGCAAQLNSNTLDVASTVQSLYREQALINVSKLIDNPNTIPSQVDISGGTVQTQNALSSQATFPIGNQVTRNGALLTQTIVAQARSLMFGVNDQWSQSWSLAPVNDAKALRRLRAVYLYAIWGENDKNTHKLKDEYKFEPTAKDNNIIDMSNKLSQIIQELDQGGWLYWKTDSDPSDLQEKDFVQNEKEMPWCLHFDASCAKSLGHYGHHELFITKENYKRGVLEDFILLLLPQADPRGPTPSGGGSAGGGR